MSDFSRHLRRCNYAFALTVLAAGVLLLLDMVFWFEIAHFIFSPIFFGLASTVGFSRIYVGAHYPGDVFSGATLGMLIAEAIRRPLSRLIR